MKNNLWRTFALTAIVLASLVALFYLPRIEIGDTMLRRVNILSDVQKRDAEGNILAEVKADSVDGIVEQKLDTNAIRVRQMEYEDKIPEGMTGIEDFADPSGVHREMDKFYRALANAGSRNVRVAYFGDSYIEGDILTMDLRNMLQSKYGGRGVGFVEINCVSSGFRRTVTARRSGWGDHHANDRGGFNKSLQGIAGSYFVAHSNATFEIRGQRNVFANQLDTAEVATVFFTPGAGLDVTASVNGGEATNIYSAGGSAPTVTYSQTYDTVYTDSGTVEVVARERKAQEPQQSAGGGLVAKQVTGRINSLKLNVTGGGGSRFYGVALDGKYGVSVDNFSMRGSGGHHLAGIPMQTLRQFNAQRPYDLIIIHYGLNVAGPKVKDYTSYINAMGPVIDNFKAAFPNASILVVSMGDRDKRGADGQMHTMGGVKELVQFERKMASDHKVAFWNLYEAMGGDGSIAKMKERKEANLDYTHINFAGGHYLAQLLFDVLINGKENYGNRTSL